MRNLPKGIGVLYPRDKLHPGHASFPLITRRMVDAVGFYVVPWFPFWWIDTWADEIGIMLGLRREIDAEVGQQEERGKSHGLVDLPFWVEFFNGTRPLRARDAINLARLAYPDDPRTVERVMAALPQMIDLCVARTAHLSSPKFLAHWAEQAASPPPPQYPQVKAYAEKLLADVRAAAPRRLKVCVAVPSGRTWEANTANAVAALTAFSAAAGIEIMLLNVQTSVIAHSRNSTVELALEHKPDYVLWIDSDLEFPPDTLMRLLKHQRDIVGAVYNKKTPNLDGSFTTLGLLDGAKPDDLYKGGLRPARLLPGGMMLVKTSVYSALSRPWFFDTYAWPGEDGLASFKAMLRDIFREVPPDDALAALDGSALALWLQDHYLINEVGPNQGYFSEDLFFCRKARKAGFEIWCDLDVSFELRHLGTLIVTCKNMMTAPEHQRDDAEEQIRKEIAAE
jgi:hypothetical protein